MLLDWKLVGATCAGADSHIQAEFFKGFAAVFKEWESGFHRQRQVLFIRDELTKEEQDVLEESLCCLWKEADNGQA
jgi:hypothetical protein